MRRSHRVVAGAAVLVIAVALAWVALPQTEPVGPRSRESVSPGASRTAGAATPGEARVRVPAGPAHTPSTAHTPEPARVPETAERATFSASDRAPVELPSARPGPAETDPTDTGVDAAAASPDSAPPGGPGRLALREPDAPPRSGGFDVRGADPLGPRPLALWSVAGPRPRRLARGASRADGALEFPPLRVPPAGLELVVAPAGARPDDPSASAPLVVAPRPVEPPRAAVLSRGEGHVVLRVAPAEAAGRVIVAETDGTVLHRSPLPATPHPGSRSFDLTVWLGDVGAEPLRLAHESPDGRLSRWREIPLDTGAEPVP